MNAPDKTPRIGGPYADKDDVTQLPRLGDITSLMKCEAQIENAQRNAYLEIGLALRTIRDKRFYKVLRDEKVKGRYAYETFEEYCESRWEIKKDRAEQLIQAASAVEKLPTIVGILPARESHVRPLLKLKDDSDREQVWRAITVNHRPETITAKVVESEVEIYEATKNKNWFTLDEWKVAPDSDRVRWMQLRGSEQFNKQDTGSIEWAQWSWNPVTGCKHDCPYCYARDIAERFYAQKFEPTFLPSRLAAPVNTKVPDKAIQEIGFRNVFTCSMADLFGRWVPEQWIEAVLRAVDENRQWNFLFLTKFPKRLAEFDFPPNAWVGTTVDCQARVKAAEDAFERVNATVRWLSIEPMIEPLHFTRLDLFNWMVIGGASKSNQTPEWRVPLEWWAPLHLEAKRLGLTVYHKTNLFDRERGYPSAPYLTPTTAPEPFQYLKSKSKTDIEQGEAA